LNNSSLDELCRQLSEMTPALEASDAWPKRQLSLCAGAGVYGWFFERSLGGAGWSEREIVEGYLKLSSACLTTTFIITQRMGACRRIVDGGNEALRKRLLPALISGEAYVTVGISHLTTSRRHMGKPALAAKRVDGGFMLNGFSPWVTGALHADYLVVGAELDDGRQILAAPPTDLPGMSRAPFVRLMALSASHTGEVHFRDVFVEDRWLLAGPMENVMQHGPGAGTGGATTSALALGLADAAIAYLETSARKRSELSRIGDELREKWSDARGKLLALAEGSEACTASEMRSTANGLVQRATEAALVAAKGTGFVQGHPVGRWRREALFFLVWSCPAPVQAAHLCELAGLESEPF
jgi:alkylation response protein AidB-like acyl-CoA dehydrogenase